MGAKQKEVLETMVTEMLDDRIIEPSVSPWGAPCLLIHKQNKKDFRFVVDYRQLNKCTEFDAHALPTTEDALESVGASQPTFFSTLDLKSGFYQVEIDEKSRPYTAWRCHIGSFQFRRLPMGLKNSPATFQRLMETVLRGSNFKFCLIYLDDIIVYSRTFPEHLKHLKEVFERLRSSGLKLNPGKCSFARKEIKYLGHKVSATGISPDPEKINSVKNYPTPKSVKQIRAFLGLSGYYRKFINNYAATASPLYNLTKKNVNFTWDDKCEAAFQHLKDALTSPPILAYPDFEKPFRLYTDASSFAVGGVLAQVQDGIERVICYTGRSLNHTEQQYGITEKECLALVFSVKKLDCYLRYNKFTAYVDHAALKWLLSMKEPVGKFARWIALLQSYDMDITYRPGVSHGNADGVSRRTYETEDDIETENLLDILPKYESTEETETPAVNVTKKRNTKINKRNISREEKQSSDNLIESVNIWTKEHLSEEQRKDPWYNEIITFLETGDLPNNQSQRRKILVLHPYYFIQDGILYRFAKRNKRQCKDIAIHVQIAVPKKFISNVSNETHNPQLSGGHLGISRTIQKTERQLFWPSMCKDITNWIRACEQCSQRKSPQNQTKAKISHMPIASHPFERVSTDILGPLSIYDTSKNQYVLVFICYLTKYVELIPLRDIKASTVATAFVNNVVCRHGTPMFLHSDRGSNFLSHIITETCKLLEVHKTQTTSYRPQCNGQRERMMSTIKNMLSKYTDDISNWDRFIPLIQFAYNTSPSIDTTDYTPFFLVHGRHPKSPIDVSLPSLVIHQTARDYITSLLEELEIARKVAIENLHDRKQEMLKKTNRNKGDPHFKLGDIVYMYKPSVPGNNRKLKRPWVGPFDCEIRRILLCGMRETVAITVQYHTSKVMT
ncbi:hypothetical protein FSP39_014461 [Pinctada imbricata]|uniref:Uncharacterized protein n=1 Tax=Pinctada imbricata TaxID=66713 RepID=A0AA88YJ45_PINIB|nr:hypothetical protein FSP39_014461 [Pinctada imbricata]